MNTMTPPDDDTIEGVIDDADAAAPPRATGTQTLERGLEILELAAREPMTIADVARRTGFNRGVAYRLVGALVARHFLVVGADGRLHGGPTLLRLGSSAQTTLDLAAIVRPQLATLAKRTTLSAFLGQRDGDHSVHLLRVSGNERVAVTTQPGTRRLLAETGIGKALMLDDNAAEWKRLFALADPHHRKPDWIDAMNRAVESQVVLQHGPAPDCINSVATPIRNASGQITAAINVAASSQYMSQATMEAIAPVLLDTARTIGEAIGRYR